MPTSDFRPLRTSGHSLAIERNFLRVDDDGGSVCEGRFGRRPKDFIIDPGGVTAQQFFALHLDVCPPSVGRTYNCFGSRYMKRFTGGEQHEGVPSAGTIIPILPRDAMCKEHEE